MEVSVRDAARILGKSARTVRHLIKTEKLPARREGRAWWIKREDLVEVDPSDRASRQAQVAHARQQVDDAFDAATPGETAPSRKTYSVRDLDVFQATKRLIVDLGPLAGDLPEVAQGRAALQDCLRCLADGAHQFHRDVKLRRFQDARTYGCAALADLAVASSVAERAELVEALEDVETQVLRRIRGLVRSVEKGR